MTKAAYSSHTSQEQNDSALSSIRHDVKGLLSPALLAADKLSLSKDPEVKKTAQVIIESIERVAQRLNQQ